MSNLIRLVAFHSTEKPVLDTSAYANGDRLGSVQIIDKIPISQPSHLTLINVGVLDKSGNAQPIDLYFFNKAPTNLSNDNDALTFDLTDCVGCASVLECDYCTVVGGAVANAVCQLPILPSKEDDPRLWIVAQYKGTDPATYGANDVTFKYYFAPDYS